MCRDAMPDFLVGRDSAVQVVTILLQHASRHWDFDTRRKISLYRLAIRKIRKREYAPLVQSPGIATQRKKRKYCRFLLMVGFRPDHANFRR
ncbi:MAG: hypothetical protein CMN21_05585 [Rubinisphaera sp.]|nr:hypothetical protein [Rubinisphaera sp.]